MSFKLPKYSHPDFTAPEFVNSPDARFEFAEADGVAPEGFHSTSMYPEYFKIEGKWVLAADSRMDSSVVIGGDGILYVVENRNIKKGDKVILGRTEKGEEGIYMHCHGFEEPGEVLEDRFVFRQNRSRETSYARDYDRLIQLLRQYGAGYSNDEGKILIFNDTTKQVLGNISDALSTAIRWVINCAPFGIMGLVFATVSSTGLSAFASYIHVILVLVCCMFFVALVVNPIIVFLCIRRNPFPLVFQCLKESGVMAFFTRSSAANIPINMQLCDKLGLDKEHYSVAIPLGATINMDGAAVTITVMSLTAAFSQGIEVNFVLSIILSFVATLGACGASGVAGGSLLLIPMACSLLGVGQDVAMQMVGVGFIIGVVQDSLETAINSSGDVIFCATAEFRDRMKKGEKIKF